MFSVAEFLDRAKARAGIETDYRLAKVIEITHSAISSYRTGKTLPDESAILKICQLSGDDPEVIAAEVQAARSKTDAARTLWLNIAQHLKSMPATAFSAIFAVCFAMNFIAGDAQSAPLPGASGSMPYAFTSLYIVSILVECRAAIMRTVKDAPRHIQGWIQHVLTKAPSGA